MSFNLSCFMIIQSVFGGDLKLTCGNPDWFTDTVSVIRERGEFLVMISTVRSVFRVVA